MFAGDTFPNSLGYLSVHLSVISNSSSIHALNSLLIAPQTYGFHSALEPQALYIPVHSGRCVRFSRYLWFMHTSLDLPHPVIRQLGVCVGSWASTVCLNNTALLVELLQFTTCTKHTYIHTYIHTL